MTDKQPKGFTVTMRAAEKGGLMVVEWDGEDNTPIWMGTDELLTLTPKETALRNAMVEKMQVILPKPDPEPKVAPQRDIFAEIAPIFGFGLFAISAAAITSPSGPNFTTAAVTFALGVVLLAPSAIRFYEKMKNPAK